MKKIFLIISIALLIIIVILTKDKPFDDINSVDTNVSNNIEVDNDTSSIKSNNKLNAEPAEPQETENLISSDVDQYWNKGYVLSMNIFLRLNQIPMVENVEDINKMKLEIEGFEEDFNLMEATEDTIIAEESLKSLITMGYEIIDLYSRKLNGEVIKSYTVLEKITIAQEEYLTYSKEFDDRNTPMSKETIEEVSLILGKVLKEYSGNQQ